MCARLSAAWCLCPPEQYGALTSQPDSALAVLVSPPYLSIEEIIGWEVVSTGFLEVHGQVGTSFPSTMRCSATHGRLQAYDFTSRQTW